MPMRASTSQQVCSHTDKHNFTYSEKGITGWHIKANDTVSIQKSIRNSLSGHPRIMLNGAWQFWIDCQIDHISAVARENQPMSLRLNSDKQTKNLGVDQNCVFFCFYTDRHCYFKKHTSPKQLLKCFIYFITLHMLLACRNHVKLIRSQFNKHGNINGMFYLLICKLRVNF